MKLFRDLRSGTLQLVINK